MITLLGILLAVAILLAIAFGVLWRIASHKASQMGTALDAAVTAARGAGAQADELAELARRHERRATEFFGIIEGVEKERDLWQRFYRESSQAAGAAQAWLIRDMSAIVKTANMHAQRLREKGEKVPVLQVDPSLQRVIEEFSQEHVSGHQEIQSTDAMARARAVADTG